MATVSNISSTEYRALLRNDLSTFIHRSFLELNPVVTFLENWSNELIASKLQACFEGGIKRLIINIPPRSLKSHSAAVAFPAFVLGHNPSAQIICASYGQDLANKHSFDCRNLVSSVWYQSLFPGTRLSGQKQSLQEFVTTHNGFRLATSVGGVLTGRGADIIIIDDPLKPDEAVSESQRNAVNEWYDHTLYSRLNDKRTGCIIIIMQRLHEDDLVGHVLEQEPWEHLRLAAIAEEEETHVIRSVFGSRIVERQPGEALHPEREPLAVLDHIRQTIGQYNFAGQYQQQPVPLGGGMVKMEWLKFYKPGEEPAKFDLVVQSWDTANKSTELSDYSVCTTWGRKRDQLYLLHVLRERMDYPDLKRALRQQYARFRPSNILIEDKASGTQFIQELIREGMYGITRYEPTMDKQMRLFSVTNTIENGFVWLPYEALWLDAYIHELISFPSGKHDDQVDSTSQVLDWAKNRPSRLPVLEYELQQARRLGLPISQWLLDEWNEAERAEGPPTCPKCQHQGPAQYGRTCHCNQCGHEWEPRNPLNEPEPIRCKFDNGLELDWDERIGLWVNPKTGEKYPPGPDPEG